MGKSVRSEVLDDKVMVVLLHSAWADATGVQMDPEQQKERDAIFERHTTLEKSRGKMGFFKFTRLEFEFVNLLEQYFIKYIRPNLPDFPTTADFEHEPRL